MGENSPSSRKPQVCGKLGALSEKRGFRTRNNFLRANLAELSAAANEADFAKRLLADIYAKSAKLTASQPPQSCEFEDNPTALTSFETAEVFLAAR